MGQPKRTGWFDRNIKPVWPGLYEVINEAAIISSPVNWAYFDGKLWHEPSPYRDVAEKAGVAEVQVAFKWRGRQERHRDTLIPSVYVYGPAGCGKTTNGKRLAKAFGMVRVIDEFYGWDTLSALGQSRVSAGMVLLLGEDPKPKLPPNTITVSFHEAMKRIG